MTRSSVTDVARNFASYLNRVAFHGERFTLTRGGRPIATLAPVPAGRRLDELPELLASLPRLGAEDAAAFGDEADEARRTAAAGEVRDPWAS